MRVIDTAGELVFGAEIGLAEDYGSAGAQACDNGSVLCRNPAGELPVSTRAAQSGDVDPVFD